MGLLFSAVAEAQKFDVTPVAEKKISQLPSGALSGPAGPPGAKTPVHMHPGSETFYVLSGQLTQKTPEGVNRVSAGQSMHRHSANTPMQVSSSGTGDLTALVMFVNDATKPVSSPATMS